MGLGYVGMVAAACLAEKGHSILGIEIDPEKPDRLDRIERAFLRNSRIGLASDASLNMKCGRDDIVYKFMEVVEKL